MHALDGACPGSAGAARRRTGAAARARAWRCGRASCRPARSRRRPAAPGSPRTPPRCRREVRLVDHVGGARADRVLGEPLRLARVEVLVVEGRQRDDGLPLAHEPGEVRLLVLVSLAEDEVAVRGVELRLHDLAACGRERQRRQVRAGEMVGEVRRRQPQRPVVATFHGRSISVPAGAPYGTRVGSGLAITHFVASQDLTPFRHGREPSAEKRPDCGRFIPCTDEPNRGSRQTKQWGQVLQSHFLLHCKT